MTNYTISVPQQKLDDLHDRLARTRYPNVPPGADGHGLALDRVVELVEAWQRFDWRAVEDRLNRYPQRIVDVDGVPIHLLHAPGSGGLPIVLLHGWADSFFGLLGLVEPLIAAGHDVVVPSLPGYGFSGQPEEKLTVPKVAEIVDAAVGQLGIERYAVHGGDWGSAVAEQLALAHTDHVAAIHLNDVPYYHQFMVDPSEATDEAERSFLAGNADWGDKGGYVGIQSTQPLTLAYGLADSPVGLLAWVGEKMHAWTDRQPLVDDVLTQVSIYWFGNTIWSSMRLYAESMDDWDGDGDWATGSSDGAWGDGDDAGASWLPQVTIPAAFALHPSDISTPPRVFAERFFTDIRRFSLMPAGGHFAAREEPAALAAEIVDFLRSL